eukprot:287904-Amphidinium_carterae.1
MRYGYHASSLSLNALDNIMQKGLVPGGQNDGDWAVRDSVHLCPLHPTHNDAVGIWSLNRPAKEKNRYDGPSTQVIFVVDLLMLQEEYDASIYQARSGNYLIPSVVPWNCVCRVINARGTAVDMWHSRVCYGQMDASIDAERLLSERQKKRTRTTDPEFKERRTEMDREEFANLFSSSSSTQKPKAAPKPPPKAPKAPPPTMPPPPQGKAMPKGPPAPPPPEGEAASSSFGVQFGVPQAPKPPPPIHMRGTTITTTRSLAETMGATWSGYYGDIFSESNDVISDFDKILPQRASRLSILEGHPSSALWPRKENKTKNCFAITSSFDWKAKGPTIKEAQKASYLSLDGPLTVTLPNGERYQVPITGTPDKLSGFIGPSIEAFDIARSIDYLLGHMLNHEQGLIEVVRRELEDRIANLTNEQLMKEGAAWFGWHSDRREAPVNFIPTTLFNNPKYEYMCNRRRKMITSPMWTGKLC